MQSEAQRAYLHKHNPELAARWEDETPEGKRLPAHVRHEEPRPKKKRPPKRWAER
jgi:hypothetical protein